MSGEVGGILYEAAVVEIVPGIAYKHFQITDKIPRRVENLIGEKGFQAMLVGAAGIDRIADPKGIDPLHDGIADMKRERVHVEKKPAMQETAAGAQLIV